jgi:enoyl-CoA hydratase/carnithine racemase
MANNARVLCTTTNGIWELVMDNPGRRNALSLSLLDDLQQKLVAARDRKPRAVILTGSGDIFSAGADFRDLTGTIDDLGIDNAIAEIVDCIRSMPAPVIAAVEGACMGGAVDIALACDFLVASEDAFFEVPATRMGLLYNPRALMRWRSRLSGLTLRRMLLLGERFPATEAIGAGVVSHLAAPGSSRKKSLALAERALLGTSDAVAASKGLLVALESGDTDLTRWEKMRLEILASPERHDMVARAKKAKKD